MTYNLSTLKDQAIKIGAELVCDLGAFWIVSPHISKDIRLCENDCRVLNVFTIEDIERKIEIQYRKDRKNAALI